MNISKDHPSSAIGYIRVSTEKQAAGDRDLERQAEGIRKACARRGMTLLGIYEDTSSGADRLGLVRRGDLKAAAERARAEHAVLVIPEPTRLFRNVEAAREFLDTYDIPIFSVREGRFLKKRALLNAVARGEEAVQNIRKGTAEALARKKAEGVVFSDHPGRVKAAEASARVHTRRSRDIVLEVARVLRADPSAHGPTSQELADRLNAEGILTGKKRRWTKDGVRRPRKAAESILAEWDDIAKGDITGIVLDSTDHEIASEKQPAPDTLPVDPDDPDGELRRLPNFGMF